MSAWRASSAPQAWSLPNRPCCWLFCSGRCNWAMIWKCRGQSWRNRFPAMILGDPGHSHSIPPAPSLRQSDSSGTTCLLPHQPYDSLRPWLPLGNPFSLLALRVHFSLAQLLWDALVGAHTCVCTASSPWRGLGPALSIILVIH